MSDSYETLEHYSTHTPKVKSKARARREEVALSSSDTGLQQPRFQPDDSTSSRLKVVFQETRKQRSRYVCRIISPFIPEILEAPLPTEFRMPSIETYNGTSDPVDHLESFKAMMLLYGSPDGIMCRAFPTTLRGVAQMWFTSLPPESISSFEELSELFVGHFVSSKKQRKTSVMLMRIKQHKGESLRSYIHRFNMEMLEVPDLDQTFAVVALMEGVRRSPF
ncbi:hypothetical protein J5N97_002958 [Dioscorea zingiberensis]|uniref:Retrotransposon gag domain-containing protein n=1 Tax=Dioscorea zingiberensis TaxID=325984 RepID=A0A9D5HQU8_9LILI|nr:hypothetical protein J5N97_002958 [Dioscorea zingiberensis]